MLIAINRADQTHKYVIRKQAREEMVWGTMIQIALNFYIKVTMWTWTLRHLLLNQVQTCFFFKLPNDYLTTKHIHWYTVVSQWGEH